MAATMSDPERNPAFRRRWIERQASVQVWPVRRSADDSLGAIGLALTKAWRSKRADRRETSP